MTTKNKIILGVAVVVLAIIAGFWYIGSHSSNVGAVNPTFGQGQVQTDAFIFVNGLSAGANQQFYVDKNGNEYVPTQNLTAINATSTSATTQTLTQGDINGYSSLALTPTVGSNTITLPATSTLTSFIPVAGNQTTLYVYNATTTAGILLTIGGGTGMNLTIATSTAASTVVLSPKKAALFQFLRLANSDISVTITQGL